MMTKVGVFAPRVKHMAREEVEFCNSELYRIGPKLVDDGMRELGTGCAPGIEEHAAKLAVDGGIELYAFLPFPDEDLVLKWDPMDCFHYTAAVKAAAGVNYACQTVPDNMLTAYHARALDLLTWADLCVFAFSPARRTGGTWHAFSMNAEHTDPTPFVLIDPVARKTTKCDLRSVRA